MSETIVNPIGKFYVEGVPNQDESIVGISELFGEDGARVTITFDDPKAALSIGMLILECAKTMHKSVTHGIDSVIKEQQEEAEMSVEDFLDE